LNTIFIFNDCQIQINMLIQDNKYLAGDTASL